MSTTLNVADKPTLDSVLSETATLITRGGIRHNGTNPQVYDTTNDTWVDLPSGCSLSPTIIIKNHFYQDGDMDNLDITVSDVDGIWTTTANMGTGDSITVEVPWIGKYELSCTFQQKFKEWEVDVTGIGGTDGNYRILIVPFSTGTDKQIKAMLDAYYNDDISWSDMGWAVGDTRVIHLNDMKAPNPNSTYTWNAQDITVVIVAHDHTTLATPVNGKTKACITVQTREVINNCTSTYNTVNYDIWINGDSSYDSSFTSWSNLYMRSYLNSIVWGAFPNTFKKAIKPAINYRHTTYNGTTSEQVIDNLFLPSNPEIYGTNGSNYYTETSPAEGIQFEYYKTFSNIVKYGNNNGASNGTAVYWWTGSPSNYYSSNQYYYWCLANNSGVSSHFYGSYGCALAPAFAM